MTTCRHALEQSPVHFEAANNPAKSGDHDELPGDQGTFRDVPGHVAGSGYVEYARFFGGGPDMQARKRSLDDLREPLRAFLLPVAESLIAGDDFNQSWNAGGPCSGGCSSRSRCTGSGPVRARIRDPVHFAPVHESRSRASSVGYRTETRSRRLAILAPSIQNESLHPERLNETERSRREAQLSTPRADARSLKRGWFGWAFSAPGALRPPNAP